MKGKKDVVANEGKIVYRAKTNSCATILCVQRLFADTEVLKDVQLRGWDGRR